MDGTERLEQVDSKIFPKSNVSSIKHFNKGIESFRFVLFKEYSLLSCFYVTCCFSCLLFELFPNATSSLHSKECYYGHSLVKPHLIFY